jgi:hypothetical protein
MITVGFAELFIYAIPLLAGVIGSRYLTKWRNFALMLAVLYVDTVLFIFFSTGRFNLGWLLSPSGLLPLLVIALVAIRLQRSPLR